MSEEDKNKETKEQEIKDDKTQSEGEKRPLDESQPINDSKPIISEQESSETGKNEEERKERQVIHKKDGRLHVYVRQDKYKGELKSKNWVGRLYIDGKQKISSSGTPNLDEAIPILEKWFDDIHTQKEKGKEQESSETGKNEEEKKERQVIHKKDGRLQLYVRQEKYKVELKSKNWVGRLYID